MSKPSIVLALLCAGIPTAHAANGDQPLRDCVDLAPGHELARFGSQYLLVKDGDAHYRLGFGGGCAAISLSTDVRLRADGKDDRLCPQGTSVVTRGGICTVRGVVQIDRDRYESYARRGRGR